MANILFVDDETMLCDLSKRFFTMKNHKIDTAENYLEATELLSSNTYDVVLIDINMPGEKNGIDLLKEISLKSKDLKTILITGSPSLDSATDAVRFGAFDYILKPYDINTLISVVDKALQEKRQNDESKKLHNTLEKYQGMLEKTLMEQIHEIRKANDTARVAHLKSLQMLAKAAEYHDDATSMHIERVGEYSYIIAKNLGLSVEDQDLIRYAAPMHDVGKVGIPYQILTKPAKLTSPEFSLIKEHCVIGYNILKDEDHPYHQASGIIALSHHERFDGKGYPYQLLGEQIPLFGRIVAITDVFDALVSVRSYKTAWPVTDAVAHIAGESGKHFDPEITSCFVDSIQEIDDARKEIDKQEAELASNHDELTQLKEKLIQYHQVS